jgi:hypothetical protein
MLLKDMIDHIQPHQKENPDRSFSPAKVFTKIMNK